MAFHHNTISHYTAALLDFFNNLEVQYVDSTGNSLVKSIPIIYSSKEKSHLLDTHTSEQLASGNYNVLPRANLALSVMTKLDQRIMNKNNKINTKSNIDTFDYLYNSVPYEFDYEVAIMCRGMNEASQIIEQIAPKFNPIVSLDIWDAQNLDVPTRIPVKLLDISIESEEYDELSSNLVTVNVGISLTGSLYPPIVSLAKIKQFKMNINEQHINQYTKKIIDNWTVNSGGNLVLPGTSTQIPDTITYAPTIIDIVSSSVLTIGTNAVTVIWDDKDNTISEMTFAWVLVQGIGTLVPNLDQVQVDITASGIIELQCTITDPYGNFATLNKLFTV